MSNIFVFGDTGGHYKQLFNGLKAIGMNPDTYELPDDTMVIHVGDLVHKGPLSGKVIAMIDTIMKVNPGQWIQIIGNHESQYIDYDFPEFWYQQTLDIRSQTILSQWVDNGLAHYAYVLPEWKQIQNALPYRPIIAGSEITPLKPIVFTHAGLGYGWWKTYAGAETNPKRLEANINNAPVEELAFSGEMLYGRHNDNASPVWAHSITEVWDSWEDKDAPFYQVHGHISPFVYDMDEWFPGTEESYIEKAQVNKKEHFCVANAPHYFQVSIDPGFEKLAKILVQPSLKIVV